jgi:catechol 2,3-dioxygenase
MGVDPLDLGGLLGELEIAHDAGTWTGLPSGTIMGHMHLQVAHLGEAERFYAEILGFDVTARYSRSALFVSAGGYHHHLGLNTWLGVGAPPPPPGAIGLRHFDLEFSSVEARGAALDRLRAAGLTVDSVGGEPFVRDPSANGIAFLLRKKRG